MQFDFTKEPGKQLLNRGLNTQGEPLVSIITPYYNAGKYFEQTFNCVMNQTFPWFEWIIVDDESTDEESILLLEKLSQQDHRICVFRKKNGGPANTRNFAIDKANTEYVISLDADDLISPTYLETTFWALQMNPDAGWAYTDSIGFDQLEYMWKVPFSSERLKKENFLIEVGTIRKKALLEAGKYDDRQRYSHEDWRLWLQLLSKGYSPVHLGYYGAWYRRVDNGAYNETEKDVERKKQAHLRIKEITQQIKKEILPIEYPCRKEIDYSFTPTCSTWVRKVFEKHDKIHMMMLLPWMEMGGADLFNLDVCRMLDKNRFEVSILTTQAAVNSWQQHFEEHVTDIFNLPDFLDQENWPEFISYFIKSREIDVLFLSNSYYGYYLMPWLRKEFPHLAIIDYVHMEEWYWRNGGYARTSGVMGEIVEGTYVCNDRTRRVMINDFGRKPESVETLYIGVDQDKYDAEKVEAGLIRKELGIAEERPIILFPCRIHPQKRPFLMVEIAKELKKTKPDVAFVVVGDGPQLEELRVKVAQEQLTDTIYLAGRQSDMRPYYKDSAMTLICSIKEGLALTAYESLSMSRPVITSGVGGQAELVNNQTGRVVPLLQSEAEELDRRVFTEEEIRLYVNAIGELLDDPKAYTAACAACRARIETGFSTRIMIRKLETVLNDLVNNEAKIARRKEHGQQLKTYSHMIDDFVTTYHLLDAVKVECEEVWKAREWFRKLYEQESQKSMSARTECEEVWKGREWFRQLYEQEQEKHSDETAIERFDPQPVAYGDAKEQVLSMYRSGGIGFKYILRYTKAWIKYKLFKK